MGTVFNSGSGGIICDCCHNLIAIGNRKIKLLTDQIFLRKTKKGNILAFCSNACFKKTGGTDLPFKVITAIDGESFDNPFSV
jgi:hypothetical protein